MTPVLAAMCGRRLARIVHRLVGRLKVLQFTVRRMPLFPTWRQWSIMLEVRQFSGRLMRRFPLDGQGNTLTVKQVAWFLVPWFPLLPKLLPMPVV